MVLVNCHIAPYRLGTHFNHEPLRPRVLLLNRKEIKRLTKAMKKVKRGLKGFAKYMQVCGFDTRSLFYRPAVHMWAWAKGHPWEKIVKEGRMAEGDLAMLVSRTADNLRHIRTLSEVFPKVAATAGKAVDLIMREPVSWQYR